MKEIGGYFEFENLINHEYHKKAISFNSARNCLRFIIRERKIKKLYLPIYLCGVVYNACKKETVNIQFYHINNEFLPDIERIEGGYIYINNYYGLLTNAKLKKMKKKYRQIIVDNTQSFFQKPIKGIDTIYNCRKYFGVPDGAYLYTDIKGYSNYDNDTSRLGFEHLLGRYEETADKFYNKFIENDNRIELLEIKKMSKITKNIMGAINYKKTLYIRKKNFKYLYHNLFRIQKLNISSELTFCYPLYTNKGQELRQHLIKKKIYIPKLWPDIFSDFSKSSHEDDYINNILPIPIDQRYTTDDMKYITDIIKEYEVLHEKK